LLIDCSTSERSIDSHLLTDLFGVLGPQTSLF